MLHSQNGVGASILNVLVSRMLNIYQALGQANQTASDNASTGTVQDKINRQPGFDELAIERSVLDVKFDCDLRPAGIYSFEISSEVKLDLSDC